MKLVFQRDTAQSYSLQQYSLFSGTQVAVVGQMGVDDQRILFDES
jgi:hypothetical protein